MHVSNCLHTPGYPQSDMMPVGSCQARPELVRIRPLETMMGNAVIASLSLFHSSEAGRCDIPPDAIPQSNSGLPYGLTVALHAPPQLVRVQGRCRTPADGVEIFRYAGAREGCVFLKGVNLRLLPRESSGCGSVCMFRGVPGVSEGDRCWSAGMSAGCRMDSGPGRRGAGALAVPGSFRNPEAEWTLMTPWQAAEARRWRFLFR